MGNYSTDVRLELLKNVALKLRFLRKNAKMPQSELAKRSGVSLGGMKRFESTESVSFEFLLKLYNNKSITIN